MVNKNNLYIDSSEHVSCELVLTLNRAMHDIFIKNISTNVSCEFDEFRVDTFLCKLRTS